MAKSSGWYTLALVAVAGLLALYAQRRDLYGLYLDYEASRARVGNLQAQVDALDGQVAALEKRVQHLNSNPLELEAAIRNGKNLIREGETVYRVELPDEAP